ncbi:MAG: trigger factor [Bacteroidota bacterium]
MANIVREDKDNLTSILTLTIEPQDYKQKFNSELAKFSQQANMKGFRKGKTPKSIIRKMYGKGILEEAVSEVFQRELRNYIEEEFGEVVLQPLMTEGAQAPTFDPKSLDSYEYSIEVGRAPEFDIVGIQEGDSYSKYKIETVSGDLVEKEFESARKRVGERVTSEEDIQENDLVNLYIKGGEGSEIDNTFSVLIGDLITDELKELLLSKKHGDTFEFVPANIEKDADEERVLRYFLGYESNDEDEEGATAPDIQKAHQFEIKEVSRIEPAEVTEEFLKEQFGEEVTTEEAAHEMIENRLLDYYNQQADIMLQNDILERVTSENKPELPETFIKRFMKETQNTSEAEIEEKLEDFKKGIVWELISKRLMKEHDLEVQEQELLSRAQQQIASYFGGQADPEMLNNMTYRMLQDENFARQIYDAAVTEKIATKLGEVVTIEDDIKTTEEMDEIFKVQQEKREKEEAERIAAQVEEAAAAKEAEEAEADAEVVEESEAEAAE